MKVKLVINMFENLSDLTRSSDGFIHLQRTYSELFKKTTYRCSYQLIINRITEYDLKSANVSAMRASHKFSDDVIEKLESVSKKTREVKVGLMIREDKEVGKLIKRGIRHAKEMLFAENNIQDQEVLSIKNDAVFVIGRKLKYTEFGPYQFIPKNVFSLYLYLEKIEFYYDGKDHTVVTKGLGKKAESDEDHKNGMLQFFATVFEMLVKGRRDDLRKYLIQFSEDYKSKKLPIYYYKELSTVSVYRTIFKLSEYEYNLEIAGESDKDIIDGTYNYMRFILPIIQTFM